ncbi:MAG: hypothetical protein QXO62_06695 [Thermoproteota archaeon]
MYVPEQAYRECPVYIVNRRKPIGYTNFEKAKVAVEKWKIADWYRDGILVYDVIMLLSIF